uniref:helix-turn-helix domain-containing protein n=1 Tax=Photorhabdus sp. RM322S TaxID=3342825 RepID=UPI0036DC3D93
MRISIWSSWIIRKEIYLRRQSGTTIGQLAKKFKLGEATIYRVLNVVKLELKHEDK